jgi:hypothetical protein
MNARLVLAAAWCENDPGQEIFLDKKYNLKDRVLALYSLCDNAEFDMDGYASAAGVFIADIKHAFEFTDLEISNIPRIALPALATGNEDLKVSLSVLQGWYSISEKVKGRSEQPSQDSESPTEEAKSNKQNDCSLTVFEALEWTKKNPEFRVVANGSSVDCPQNRWHLKQSPRGWMLMNDQCNSGPWRRPTWPESLSYDFYHMEAQLFEFDRFIQVWDSVRVK